MSCKGLHCPSCKSGGGIGAIVAVIIGLIAVGNMAAIGHAAGHIVHEIIIGLFILAGIAGLGFGIPLAIVMAVYRREPKVEIFPNQQSIPARKPTIITTSVIPRSIQNGEVTSESYGQTWPVFIDRESHNG